MKGILKDAAILFVITLVAGLCLGAVHEVTLDPIAKAPEAQLPKLIKKYSRKQQNLSRPMN
ncbi:MAG: hypothetical protein ACLT4E_06085 [Clostridium sp.]